MSKVWTAVTIFAVGTLSGTAGYWLRDQNVLGGVRGRTMQGTYAYTDEFMGHKIRRSYTFKLNGTVYEEDAHGSKIEMKYELDGKEIKMISPLGSVVLAHPDSDTIEVPSGTSLIGTMIFKKEK